MTGIFSFTTLLQSEMILNMPLIIISKAAVFLPSKFGLPLVLRVINFTVWHQVGLHSVHTRPHGVQKILQTAVDDDLIPRLRRLSTD